MEPESTRTVSPRSTPSRNATPTGLFPDLRDEMTSAVTTARAATREVWGEDVTNSGFAVPNLEAVTETHVILPKLFRRLVEFLRGGGSVSGFKRFLEKKKEQILILSTGHFTHFDTIVAVQGDTVRLTELPENLVFVG